MKKVKHHFLKRKHMTMNFTTTPFAQFSVLSEPLWAQQVGSVDGTRKLDLLDC